MYVEFNLLSHKLRQMSSISNRKPATKRRPVNDLRVYCSAEF